MGAAHEIRGLPVQPIQNKDTGSFEKSQLKLSKAVTTTYQDGTEHCKDKAELGDSITRSHQRTMVRNTAKHCHRDGAYETNK